jgi:hypothetical protein
MPKSNRKTKYTTLSEQCKNLIGKQNILHCWNNAQIKQKNKIYHTVGTMPKYNKIYYTVGTMPKSNRKTKYTTLSEQCQNLIGKQNILHC